MGKNKLRRFAEMKEFSCVFEPVKADVVDDNFSLKGKWHADYFRNENPLVVELGCGKGEYTVALAKKYPERNFVGVDVKGARIWRGSKTVEEEEIENAAFVRTKIEFINSIFDRNEVSEIWLTFSDPQPKDKKGTKRLSGRAFLKRYGKLLKKEGIIHVKTDSVLLYESTLETIQEGNHHLMLETDDLYGAGWKKFTEEDKEILSIKTFYEQKWLSEGKSIHYIRFALNDRYHKDI
jgi:tRNA (guanine-N7-)-methyltransferase